jgi:hypothetical protein
MAFFDVAKEWIILAPAASPQAWNAADELASYVGLLRNRAGLGGGRPRIVDAETASTGAADPIILLNAGEAGPDRGGFSWRAGTDRIEILGDSGRGLWKGVFDFLAALGVRWPKPGVEELPVPAPPGRCSLRSDRACQNVSGSFQDRRRLVMGAQTARAREQMIRWAIRNQYDALVFSLGEGSFWNQMRQGKGPRALIERYALIIEAGGRDFSLLLPRSLFLFHRELFRMDSGRRLTDHHFCPTSPGAADRVRKQAAVLFGRALAGMSAPAVRVFHLWPDEGHEGSWCACPACRAFSPAEQNRIAVNIAADVLEHLDPQARLSCFEPEAVAAGSRDERAPGIPANIARRNNTFVLTFC